MILALISTLIVRILSTTDSINHIYSNRRSKTKGISMKNIVRSILCLTVALGLLTVMSATSPTANADDLNEKYIQLKRSHQPIPEWMQDQLFPARKAPANYVDEGGVGPLDATVLDPNIAYHYHSGYTCHDVDNIDTYHCLEYPYCICTNIYPNDAHPPEDPEDWWRYPAFGDMWCSNYSLSSGDDWFTFTFDCPGTVYFSTCYDPGNGVNMNDFDTTIMLVSEDLDILILNDDEYYCAVEPINDYNSTIQADLPAGTYYATIGGYYVNCGNYEAEFIFTYDCGGTEVEPSIFNLAQNYPNPFNPTTTIEFSLAEPGVTDLSVYNLSGDKVVTLLDHEMGQGSHEVQFNAGSYPSGVYFYTLKAGDYLATRKMILIK